MKKIFTILLSAILVVMLCSLVACNDEISHNWADNWSNDSNNHWHSCKDSGCTAQNDLSAHIDSDDDGLCDICGYQVKDPDDKPIPTPPISDDVTLYFYNTEGWSEVYAYAYDAANNQLLGEWPGTKATSVEEHEGWVSITVNANPQTDAFNIIFNGNGSQTTDLVIDGNEKLYLIDRANGTFSSFEEAEKALSDKPIVKTTVSIHYHKNADWSESVKAYVWSNDTMGNLGELLGTWGSYEATKEEDGWYIISVAVVAEKLEEGASFNLIVYDGALETSRFDITINSVDELYLAADGHACGSKEDVYAYENTSKESYTVHYYAPDWEEGKSVNLYTYGGSLGSIGSWNTISMVAEEGKDNWYSYTFETSLKFDSSSFIFHTENESIKHEFYVEGLSGNDFYFVSNTNNVYADYVTAEEGYAKANAVPTDEIEITLNLYAPDWINVKIHTYNGYITGDWGTVSMVKDEDNEAWYTFTFKMSEETLTNTGVNIICFNGDDDNLRIETYINSTASLFMNANKNSLMFATREDALATSTEEKSDYTVHYYAPAWEEDAAIYLYTYGGTLGAIDGWMEITLSAEEGKDNWYSYSFETSLEFSSSSFIFHTANESIKHEFYVEGLSGNDFYFVSNKDNVYADYATAEADYAAASEAPNDEVEVTLYLYTSDWANVKIHTWNCYETGAWGTVSMSAVEGNTGWYSYTFKCDSSSFTSKGLNIIFFNAENDAERLATYTKDANWVYFSVAKGDQAFTSMQEALA